MDKSKKIHSLRSNLGLIPMHKSFPHNLSLSQFTTTFQVSVLYTFNPISWLSQGRSPGRKSYGTKVGLLPGYGHPKSCFKGLFPIVYDPLS